MKIEAQYVRVGDSIRLSSRQRQQVVSVRPYIDGRIYLRYGSSVPELYDRRQQLDVDDMTEEELTMRMLAT